MAFAAPNIDYTYQQTATFIIIIIIIIINSSSSSGCYHLYAE
jgi:hypothetical protein